MLPYYFSIPLMPKLRKILIFSATGVGYYHILTKHAYEIIEIRLRKRISGKVWNVNCLENCCFPNIFPCVDNTQRRLKGEILILHDMLMVVQARRNAAQPVGALDIPKDTVERIKRRSDSEVTNAITYGTDTTYKYYGVPFVYVAAAGCGGGPPAHGGGCGGYVFHKLFEPLVNLLINFSFNLMLNENLLI